MRHRSWTIWGAVLGFALGGFFDGILLHQILQWHHLLSLVPGITDLRTQILFDGLFHALMYLVALAGLIGLWRTHRRTGATPGHKLAAALLVGFGAWHVVDAVLSHWLLGIHRIRVDSPDPLVWDLIWLVGFGLLPLLAGMSWFRRPPRPGATGTAAAALVLLGLGTVAAGAWAAWPAADQPYTTVVFSPLVDERAAFAAIRDHGARLVWADASFSVVVLDLPADRRHSLYARGALLVSGAFLPLGCLDYTST